jgi:hypothetical protein
MKAILFFVAAGIVREAHKEAATAINAATGKKVVFRNGSIEGNERAETCEGTAGAPIPPQYADLPHYDNAGKLTKEAAKPASLAVVDRKLNSIGLPDGEGCPEDRESLKAALDAEGIEYHANAKTEKLAELYLAHFYPEAEGE